MYVCVFVFLQQVEHNGALLLELPVQISRDVTAISKLSVVLAPCLRFFSAKIWNACHVYSLWYEFVLWCVGTNNPQLHTLAKT